MQLYNHRVLHDIQQKDIMYIRAYDGYIETQIGNKTMRRDCLLVQLEDILNRDLFIRISKSCIVNLT
ncbi:LytTR family transcriptional regulator DNA-binding domain-containing protein [[Ruminococcus] torques]|uniref:LytTR family transcriptional regulator DNA-binding domain-containing protein n=1 Tax=[Ruminococcus] torques TaxID=33039 RepID=UPI003A3C1960